MPKRLLSSQSVFRSAPPARRQEAIALGTDAVLVKPFANEELLAAGRLRYGEII